MVDDSFLLVKESSVMSDTHHRSMQGSAMEADAVPVLGKIARGVADEVSQPRRGLCKPLGSREIVL